MPYFSRVLPATLCALSLPALGQPPEEPLPDGAAKSFVEGACVSCHQTNLINRSTGYDREDWRYVIDTMIALPDPQADMVAEYLSNHFPATTDRRPVLVSGETQISFKEWQVPTLGQRPRDPLMTPDGIVWWAGMYGSLIGRLDPRTGEMEEFNLDPTARPHSILNDRDGNIWYTGNGNGTMGMLNAKTGEITVYPMPDPAARDPHTPIFTPDGTLWFTLQNSHMLGRLDPASGEVEVRKMPTERARPYGIKVDSQGMLWIAYRGAAKIARVDPDSWEIVEFDTPNPDPESHHGMYYIRRLAIDSNDTIWYVDSGRGYLGRLDPNTGETKEWPSPSGPRSHPYAIEIIDDIIWYNESGQRPDALVRFDPKTEEFQSWAIPSGIGIIRHMRRTPDGDLVIHQSSTNTVGIVTIPKTAT